MLTDSPPTSFYIYTIRHSGMRISYLIFTAILLICLLYLFAHHVIVPICTPRMSILLMKAAVAMLKHLFHMKAIG